MAFKATAVALMIATPLAGVWLASSLAAFANRATWLPVVAGLLLFPLLPLAWDGVGTLRARKAKDQRRFLTFTDRLILRTLAINLVFLGGLLALFPSRAFVAASTRGDWMLDGHHGPVAERARATLLRCAGVVEWVYLASNDNPYRKEHKNQLADGVKPTPAPTAESSKPGSRSTATQDVAPTPTTSATTGSRTPAPSTTSDTASDTPDTNTGTKTGDGSARDAEVAPKASTTDRYPWPAKLHPAVVSIPREAEVSIESVGKYFAAHEPDPMLRVKALHDWVADRIAYDVPNYLAKTVPHEDGDADYVFRHRVGVCAGYAELLAELGKASGDEIVYLTGDVRSKESPMEGEKHAWNAAKIHGAWYLLDPTWDAGHPKGRAFEKSYKTEYLFTPPDQFILTHFPDDARWQLLEHRVARADFFRKPVVTPAFLAFGLELRSPDRSQVSAGGSIDMTIDNPRNVFLLASYQTKGSETSVDCKTDKHHTVHCDFPAAGTYDVALFAHEKEYGTYAYAASVQVNAQP